MRTFLLYVFLHIIPLLVISQSLPKTINLDVDDGLIQNTVWAIEEDNAHRIWIGTPGGIQVYDGFELTLLPEIDGISKLLESEVDIKIVGSCSNGIEVLEILPQISVDVLLLDLDMPIMNGLQCAEAVKKKYPEVKIAILTMHQEKALIQKFIEFGVRGYFLKTIQKDDLVHAIKTIAAGNDYFPSGVTKALLQKQTIVPDVTQSHLLKELTNREIEIIQLVSQGFSNNDIGEKLFISPRTADTHRTNIMRKLDMHNVAEIVRFAFHNKLID